MNKLFFGEWNERSSFSAMALSSEKLNRVELVDKELKIFRK